ncbi:hypothetical protein IWW36_002595 [Coemansia brasiliensis]|uniref:RING-type domain-containing protein n=1 Tax=Coemansia brasiliensis TaxID=2650707 RepID=A0A9W8ID71_9FUNG|nr:hypothetical protein IWW36_002595 [Coemansia brasiliensis]
MYREPRGLFCDCSSSSNESSSISDGGSCWTAFDPEHEMRLLQDRVLSLEAELSVLHDEAKRNDRLLAQVGEALQCSICLDTLTQPHSLACGHTFCQHCLLQWLARHRQCPTCRAAVACRPIVAYAIQDILRCLNPDSCEPEATDSWARLFPDSSEPLGSDRFEPSFLQHESRESSESPPQSLFDSVSSEDPLDYLAGSGSSAASTSRAEPPAFLQRADAFSLPYRPTRMLHEYQQALSNYQARWPPTRNQSEQQDADPIVAAGRNLRDNLMALREEHMHARNERTRIPSRQPRVIYHPEPRRRTRIDWDRLRPLEPEPHPEPFEEVRSRMALARQLIQEARRLTGTTDGISEELQMERQHVDDINVRRQQREQIIRDYIRQMRR